jgi:predicted RNA-binding protein YlqC (UPF0109 family)
MTGSEQQVVALMTRIVQSLVKRPERVSIQVISTSMSTLLRCFASRGDVEALTNERGEVLDSLRHLLLSFGKSAGRKFKLELTAAIHVEDAHPNTPTPLSSHRPEGSMCIEIPSTIMSNVFFGK